jgi:hypothetical protein
LKAIPGVEDSSPKEEFKKVFSIVYKPLLKQVFKDQLRETNRIYQSSVSYLAPVDPVIAYNLNGKTEIFERIDGLINQLPLQILTSGLSRKQGFLQQKF